MEVMIMLIAMSMVILSAYGAKISSFRAYTEIINRERAQLYAAETLEQLEAFKLTRVQQDYVNSWKNFLGDKEGNYQLVTTDDISSIGMVKVADDYSPPEDDSYSIKYYAQSDSDSSRSGGFFTRLERHLHVQQEGDDKRLVTVRVYWGVEGLYSPDSPQTIRVQSLYTDHSRSGFAL